MANIKATKTCLVCLQAVLITLLSCSVINGQTFIDINGGYGEGGAVIGGSLSHELRGVTLSMNYREYNIIGSDKRQVGFGIGYPFGNNVTLVPSFGLAYSWDNWKQNKEIVEDLKLRFRVKLEDDIFIFTDYLWNKNHNIQLGLRLRFRFSKNKKHRFF